MHSRLFVLTLALYLSFALAACSKKTDQTADNSNAATDTGAPAEKAKGSGKAREPKAEAPKPEPIVIPAGTSVTVRLSQAVGSKISQTGDTFSASLMNAVTVGDKTAIPAGATASGTVTDAKPLGKFAGGAVLSLKLVSITINGNDQAVETADVTQTAKGKGKRTAVVAGGGAALGALIGGLAGGGKGAAIGAVAGGGAGTAGAAFTGNKDIVLAAESAVTFKLTQPLEVTAK